MADIRHTINQSIHSLEEKLKLIILPVLNERLDTQLEKISAYFELKLDERLSEGFPNLGALDKLHSEIVTQSAYFSNVFNQLHTLTQLMNGVLQSSRLFQTNIATIEAEIKEIRSEIEELKKKPSAEGVKDRVRSLEDRVEQLEDDVNRKIRAKYGDALV